MSCQVWCQMLLNSAVNGSCCRPPEASLVLHGSLFFILFGSDFLQSSGVAILYIGYLSQSLFLDLGCTLHSPPNGLFWFYFAFHFNCLWILQSVPNGSCAQFLPLFLARIEVEGMYC